ncbi:hypothetical protein I5C37_04340 [Staphylococcus aureus]|nr:hypothetical protein I5C37_04340 [Staphylococcus aureus]
MKFPKKYTEIIKKYKNKTPEEKAKIEDDFIKEINEIEILRSRLRHFEVAVFDT